MEIVLRASFVFLFLYVLTRAMGKRELSETTPFELLLLIVLGDIVQQGIMQEDMSATGSVIAAATVGVLVLLLSWGTFRSKRAADLLEGRPTVVVSGGKVLGESLNVERLTLEELLSAARQQGVEDLSTVRLAVLEPDGKFSFDDQSRRVSDGAPDRAET